MVLLIIAHLFHASPHGLVNRALHALGDGVRIHDDLAIHITCRTSCRLRKTSVTTKESLLVCIEDSDQRHLRQVESLSQEVHADQHVIVARTQVVDNLDTVQSRHVAVDISRFYLMPHEIIRQLLRHPLRERSNKNALPPFDTDGDLFHQVINLVLRWSDDDLRIQQSCGTNQLLHHHTARLAELKVSRRCRDIDHLMHQALKLVKLQWAVVESRGQTKSILHQIFLARTVSPIHRVDLRHGDMTLVDYHQIVLRKEVQ